MKRVTRMVKRHLNGVFNALVTGATNARVEASRHQRGHSMGEVRRAGISEPDLAQERDLLSPRRSQPLPGDPQAVMFKPHDFPKRPLIAGSSLLMVGSE